MVEPDPLSQIGTEGDQKVCETHEEAITDLAALAGEMTFSAQDLLDDVEAPAAGTLFIDAGGEEEMTLALVSTGAAWLVTETPIEPDAQCGLDRVEVEVDGTLTVGEVGDRRVDAVFTTTVWATRPEAASLSAPIPLDEVGGDATPGPDILAYPDVDLVLDLTWEDAGFNGILIWSGTSSSDPSGRGELYGDVLLDAIP